MNVTRTPLRAGTRVVGTSRPSSGQWRGSWLVRSVIVNSFNRASQGTSSNLIMMYVKTIHLKPSLRKGNTF